MPTMSLKDLLKQSVEWGRVNGAGVIFVQPGDVNTEKAISYEDLYTLALERTMLLQSIEAFSTGSVVVLHFDNHYDNILWFWATVLCGGIPCPCPPLSKNEDQRRLYIEHLHTQFEDPVFLTTRGLHGDFTGNAGLRIGIVDHKRYGETKGEDKQLERNGTMSLSKGGFTNVPIEPKPEDIAVLMLTSGSTGRPKAVAITNRQINAAISGKTSVRQLTATSSFLNWIGFDHVASLVEIHLQAIYLGAKQVHVSATDVISNPGTFLRLLSKHRVERTFAPHFLLVKIQDVLAAGGSDLSTLDLTALRYLATGGEANTVDTGAKLSPLLAKLGAPIHAIVPGFGMTETCAGAIFNTKFPSYDIACQYEFASLGSCMPGIEMRISAAWNGQNRVGAAINQPGELEVSGDAVFSEYYRNPIDTTAAFTPDGWFKTGDWATFDADGSLCLVGRSKDTININGVKYSPSEIEEAVQAENFPGVTSTYLACFHYRRNGMQTEAVCVVYAPTYSIDDAGARMSTNSSISKTVMLETGSVPYVLPLSKTVMHKSTLGKLSRTQIRIAFEYATFEEVNDREMQTCKNNSFVPPSTSVERILAQQLAIVLHISVIDIGIDMPMYDMGVNSIILIRLKRQIEAALGIADLPIVLLLTNATIRTLAVAVCNLQESAVRFEQTQSYNPTVTLQPQGIKTPLWLFHPGVGEILVFMNLAKYLSDRPVYALRARGFESAEEPFSCIAEAIDIYYRSIKRTQPTGPYALAGYSYGAMLAFETAKQLEAGGDRVQFLGSFNLPPHIKTRMQKLVWSECLLHLSYFLGLITEKHSRDVAADFSTLSRAEAIVAIFEAADSKRLEELSLTERALESWTTLAFGLQNMARDYDPTGQVEGIDVFCAVPLAVVAENKEIWKSQHLSRWAEFTVTTPRIHDVEGSHYTMIDEENVFAFQRVLRKALKARGL
jgi:long-subunit acyl-CoA synthetase (AMP-forming)/thioesterase domain-containing protein